MPYTEEDARREVGDSTDWLVGIRASIKKWRQLAAGDATYPAGTDCGICFVRRNLGKGNGPCRDCIAYPICMRIGQGAPATEILKALEELKQEMERKEVKQEMDENWCREHCANFKPKPKPPFDGLKTADLKVGMVVTQGNCDNGTIYTILGRPEGNQVKALRAYKGYPPHEDYLYLGDMGCQPYSGGRWNQTNWLREVK